MNAIYVRQSVDKKDSLSIEGQIQLCRRLAGDDAAVFSDKGYSGKNTKRPAFTSLMEQVESGKIQKIFVYRLDRFSRSIADFGRLWELLEKHNVDFISVTENFDTSSPMGRAMLNIVLVFAQLERETTAERVRDNYIHRFSLGAWPGGPAPFGFDIVKSEKDGHYVSTLIANDKSDIVRKIFEEYALPDSSLRSIARNLSLHGIPGPKRELWDNVTLSRILKSPLYVKADEDVYFYYLARGFRIKQPPEAFDSIHGCNIMGRRNKENNRYNSAENMMVTVSCHNGFISSDLWLTVQNKLSGNSQLVKTNAGKYSWLTGLMKCAKCGYALKINHVKRDGKLYLICSGRANTACCNSSVTVDLRELEKYIASEIDRLLSSCANEPILNTDFSNASELFKIEQKIERLVSALSESEDCAAMYISKEIERLGRERIMLLNRHDNMNTRPRRLIFSDADFDEKKIIASEFIEKILLEDDKVNIIWKI